MQLFAGLLLLLAIAVDANILLTAVIRNSATRELLLSPLLDLYGPETLSEEVSKHVAFDEEVYQKNLKQALEVAPHD